MLSDPAVFSDDYRPQRLLHRDTERATLVDALQPAAMGERADDVLVAGSHGVGKTTLVQYVLDELHEEADIQSAFVECMGETTAGIVRGVLEDLGLDPAQNTPREDLCLQLWEHVSEPTVVVLDEAADLPETDALERLWDCDLLSVVIICHDRERWLSRLKPIHRRYLHAGEEIDLTGYTPEQLVDIMVPRAEAGLDAGTWDHSVLEAVADRADGCARTALTTLHAAATVASDHGRGMITPAEVPEGYERAATWMRESNLASLSAHHHVLYEVLRVEGPLQPDDLHERYEALADELYRGLGQTPIEQRARAYKLEKLQEYGLVTFEGENQYDEYRVCDEAVVSSLSIAVEGNDSSNDPSAILGSQRVSKGGRRQNPNSDTDTED
jgi:Cdc6-like AAA superfamily ATPase